MPNLSTVRNSTSPPVGRQCIKHQKSSAIQCFIKFNQEHY
uniref:Uncharacterized protein n=1 Tax=Arundo donax TaxID=35708 RepID=A0A0A8Y6A5_ARUDO